jgi:hypothetical protein
MKLKHGMQYDEHVRRYAIHGGNIRLRRELAFELGRRHRSRDSKGPRGRLAVFDDLALTAAYVAGYYQPYWWERQAGALYEMHPSKRIAYYRYWRVRGYTASGAWKLAKEHIGRRTEH